jgi:hypothetical protein
MSFFLGPTADYRPKISVGFTRLWDFYVMYCPILGCEKSLGNLLIFPEKSLFWDFFGSTWQVLPPRRWEVGTPISVVQQPDRWEWQLTNLHSR